MYPFPPNTYPSAFNGFGERMLHSRIAVWSYLKNDYQIYQVNREDYPAIRLIPTNSERTYPFYFAVGPSDRQSRTFTLYRPRARIHSHVDMAIWHTGGWLCRKHTVNTMSGFVSLEPVIPILNVSEPMKLQWVGNVGLNTQGCEAFYSWVQFQTPTHTRPIIHNRIMLRSSVYWEEDTDASLTPTLPALPASPTPDPIPLFVAETLLEKAILMNDMCTISMEPFKKGEAVATSCFHLFQREALAEWRVKHTTCPVCKKECATTNC
jgi:hypothetical protein